MKLLSMRLFVLWIRGMITSELCEAIPQRFKKPVWTGDKDEAVKYILALDAIKWDVTGEYAKFLSRPIELGMFVPCDDEGSPLEKPPKLDSFLEFRGKGNPPALEFKRKAYKSAEEKVLFKGWEFKDIERIGTKSTLKNVLHKEGDKFTVDFEKGYLWGIDCRTSWGDMKGWTIENLVDMEIELTKSAIKQILR